MTNKLIGYNNIIQDLVNLYNVKKLPNIILLSGKKGIGKSLLAKHFLNFIYSKDENHEYSLKNLELNNLNRSFKLLENNSHPNVFNITKKDDKKNIEISQIREMIQFQNKSSFNDKIRYIIINDIEYLNLNSANALLKSLEEPNEGLYFILINNNESKIIDTIKSRCIEFKLFLQNEDVELIVNSHFGENIYNSISKDFLNHYNSPSFLIALINFFNTYDFDSEKITINEFICEIIKNKYYLKDIFIINNINVFIELFFYKNINLSKKISYKIKEYFILRLSQIKKYNLDLESFLIEFEEKTLSE